VFLAIYGRPVPLLLPYPEASGANSGANFSPACDQLAMARERAVRCGLGGGVRTRRPWLRGGYAGGHVACQELISRRERRLRHARA
jgi:hypothetical protein